MQVIFPLSQAERAAFSTLAESRGQRPAFAALMAFSGVSTSALAAALGLHKSMVSKLRRGLSVSRASVSSLRDMGVPEDLLPVATADIMAERLDDAA